MEKIETNGRTTWVKAYQLSDTGRWFALLLAKEKDLSKKEKREILENIFRKYVRWVKDLSESLHVSGKALQEIFMEEMQ